MNRSVVTAIRYPMRTASEPHSTEKKFTRAATLERQRQHREHPPHEYVTTASRGMRYPEYVRGRYKLPTVPKRDRRRHRPHVHHATVPKKSRGRATCCSVFSDISSSTSHARGHAVRSIFRPRLGGLTGVCLALRSNQAVNAARRRLSSRDLRDVSRASARYSFSLSSAIPETRRVAEAVDVDLPAVGDMRERLVDRPERKDRPVARSMPRRAAIAILRFGRIETASWPVMLDRGVADPCRR